MDFSDKNPNFWLAESDHIWEKVYHVYKCFSKASNMRVIAQRCMGRWSDSKED